LLTTAEVKSTPVTSIIGGYVNSQFCFYYAHEAVLI